MMSKRSLSNASRPAGFQMELTGHFALFTRFSDEKLRTIEVLRKLLSNLHNQSAEFAPRHLLDLGCGHGLLSAGIAEYYLSTMKRPLTFAVLVDQNPQLLHAAATAIYNQVQTVETHHGNIFDPNPVWRMGAKKYQMAVVSNVLYYAPDTVALQRPLDAAHRRLSSYGIMPIIHEGRTYQLDRLQEIAGSRVISDVIGKVDEWTASRGHEKYDMEFAAEIALPHVGDVTWDKFARVSWAAEKLPELTKEEKNVMLILEFLASEPFGDLAQKGQLKLFLWEARDMLEECNYRFPLRQIMQTVLPQHAPMPFRRSVQSAVWQCAA